MESKSQFEVSFNGIKEYVQASEIKSVSVPISYFTDENQGGSVFLKDGRTGNISGFHLLYLKEERPELFTLDNELRRSDVELRAFSDIEATIRQDLLNRFKDD